MAGDFISAFGVGGDSPIALAALTVDAAGNQYATGSFRGTIDFSPSQQRVDGSDIVTSQNGTLDVFVAKFAPDDSLMWVRGMGSAVDSGNYNIPFERGTGIAVDGSGHVYVVGQFQGTATFGTQSLISSGESDGFLTKLDVNGNFQWTRAWGTGEVDEATDLALDQQGNIVVVGAPRAFAASGGYYRGGILAQKFTTAGNTAWSVRIDNIGGIADSVATDAAGNVYVAGTFNGTVDFNPDPKRTANVAGASGLGGGAGFNSYVLKLSGLGHYQAVTPLIGNASTNSAVSITDIHSDASGQVTVAAVYRGTIDFDPGKGTRYLLPTTSVSAGAVARIDALGKWVWATSLGANASPRSVVSDASGVYVTGSFYNVFQPTSSTPAVNSQGDNDVFLLKLSQTGTLQWSTTFGGVGSDIGYGLNVTDDSIYVGGSFSRTVDFNPDPLAEYVLENAAGGDMFIVRFRK